MLLKALVHKEPELSTTIKHKVRGVNLLAFKYHTCNNKEYHKLLWTYVYQHTHFGWDSYSLTLSHLKGEVI